LRPLAVFPEGIQIEKKSIPFPLLRKTLRLKSQKSTKFSDAAKRLKNPWQASRAKEEIQFFQELMIDRDPCFHRRDDSLRSHQT